MEEAQERLGQATTDNSRLREELQAASSELAAVEEYANRRYVLALQSDCIVVHACHGCLRQVTHRCLPRQQAASCSAGRGVTAPWLLAQLLGNKAHALLHA